jgi:hypothetical protein
MPQVVMPRVKAWRRRPEAPPTKPLLIPVRDYNAGAVGMVAGAETAEMVETMEVVEVAGLQWRAQQTRVMNRVSRRMVTTEKTKRKTTSGIPGWRGARVSAT